MITCSTRIAFVFAAFSAIASAPMSAALADSPMSPNAVTNSTSDMSRNGVSSTGHDDSAAQYPDEKGFPLGGWEYFSLPPN